MHKLYQLPLAFFALLTIILASSCDPDGGGGVNPVVLPPVLTLNSGTDLISANQDLELSTTSFRVGLTGSDGDAALRSLAIRENGVIVPATRLNFVTGQTANNPILLLGSDQNGFTYTVEVIGNSGTTGISNYEFTLTDADGLTARETLGINFVQTAPTVSLVTEDGFVSSDTTINAFRSNFSVRITSAATNADLASLTVLENGELMNAARLSINGGNVTAMNPLRFATGEENGSTYRYSINPGSVGMETRTYTFRTTDVNGTAGETSIRVTFNLATGTALQLDTTGVFFNASGMQFGGLDLDNAQAVRFNSTAAEIQDEGINTRIAPGTENWRAQISSVNDAEVKLANLIRFSDGLNFAAVNNQELIQAIFEDATSTQLDGSDDFPNTDGDQSDNELVSRPILGGNGERQGEVFVVKRGPRYYLVQFSAVNYVANSNTDNYNVAIKY